MIKVPSYIMYMLFAVLAILVNVTVQVFTAVIIRLLLGPTADFPIFTFEIWYIVSLGLGTVAGFIFKFIADKFVVFGEDVAEAASTRTARQLGIYFTFAIFTTIIFWGTETLFKILWPPLYLLGGIIGLAIGYTVKFLLDRQFVFDKEQEIPDR